MCVIEWDAGVLKLEMADHGGNLLQYVEDFKQVAYQNTDERNRSTQGQYFTPLQLARMLAESIQAIPSAVRILDPGAGVGMLSAALVEHLTALADHKPDQIHVTAYENEPVFLPLLEQTYCLCAETCAAHQVEFTWQIISRDFIAAAVNLLDASNLSIPVYDAVVLNPPYGKIRRGSHPDKLLKQAGIDTTNLYTAFLWLSTLLLRAGGSLVSITPRSFFNGPYFRLFRQAFLENMAIQKIHVFDQRDAVFMDDVLQENVIIHAVKAGQRGAVEIITSEKPGTPETSYELDYDAFVKPDDADQILHITSNAIDQLIRHQLEAFPCTLEQLHLSVSTGRVVDFRVKMYLAEPDQADIVPLIYPAHFSEGYVQWAGTRLRKPSALKRDAAVENLLVSRGFYVLVKRFSAKEEKRRIVAALYDPHRLDYEQVGFENHLNYFHQNGQGLPENLAKGLVVYLNSTLVDTYFRQFSGHTQVNATDLRRLMYPDEPTLCRLGHHIKDQQMNQVIIDALIAQELPMSESLNPLAIKQKITDALEILKAIGVPRQQQNERSALTLLALADLHPEAGWEAATAPLRGITEMMDFFRDFYGVRYKPNTRETIRRQTVHQFWQIELIVANPDEPDRPINSPKYCYQLNDAFLGLLRTYGTEVWEDRLADYRATFKAELSKLTFEKRDLPMIPVVMPDGSTVELTAGGQNTLIKQVIESFCPRFTPGGHVIYLGDAGEKISDEALDTFASLGIHLDKHGKMPDVVVYLPEKNWLVLIEVVTSHGPINIKRYNELREIFGAGSAGLVFVTVFESRKAMGQFLADISWETEVWLADAPTHLIHFNGERFLGPYE